MTELVYGSLFSGYEGLTMGCQAVLPGRTAWVSDIDKGSCKLLAHRFPDVPNLGDISAVDWSAVEPVDVLTGGFPCQDVSAAGKRAGIRPGTRSGLWTQFAYAISQLRPRLVVIENVRGLLSAKAHSDVEPCAWCLGDDTDGALRALGAVLGDLADLGYDASWYGLRAADVGAPHGRFRVFVAAYPHGGRCWELDSGQRRVSVAHPDGGEPLTLLPTPNTGESASGHGRRGGKPGNGRQSGASLDQITALLPTPAVNDMGEGKTPEAWDEWTARMKDAHGNGNGHGASLAIEAQRLLPTPAAQHRDRNAHVSTARIDGGEHQVELADLIHSDMWGDYAPAIARWEALTRPAPAPTMTSTKGNPQLAPAFVEWTMGLPAGWITAVPGLTRNDMLKLCGNGVVPQQAEAALRLLLAREAVAA